MKNNYFKKTLTIVLIILTFIILRYGILGLIIFGASATKVDYKVKNNIINVNNNKITLEEEKSYYDENSECYVILLKTIKKGEIKKRMFNKVFNETSSLDITYTIYDRDNYILGEAYGSINNLDENNKWKLKVSYCDTDAKEVKKYKVKSISIY